MRKIPALRALTELLGRAPPVAGWSTRHASCITVRWNHAALHGQVPALADNVVAAWFGGTGAIEHRHGRSTLLGHAAAGAVCIVPEGEESWIGTSIPFDGVYIVLSTEHLRAVSRESRDTRLRPCVAEHDPVIYPLVQLAMNFVSEDSPAGQLMLDLTLDLICAQLLRRHARDRDADVAHDRERNTRLDDERLARIDAYIDQHLATAVTIDELAVLVGLSRSHFCTAFRHARGITPHEHLTDRRMARARQMLESAQGPSVADVATQVGFHTTSAFCAIFKRTTGCTPTQFRRGHAGSA